jgi:hypothetical protein
VETESVAPLSEAASPLAPAQAPLVAAQPKRLAESGVAANDNVAPLRAQKRIPAKPFGGESKS